MTDANQGVTANFAFQNWFLKEGSFTGVLLLPVPKSTLYSSAAKAVVSAGASLPSGRGW